MNFKDAPIISEYNVAEAIGDGSLTRLGTTKNLGTVGAIAGVMEHGKQTEAEAIAILTQIMEGAASQAITTWDRGGIHKLDADLKPTTKDATYWLIPSELGGVTIMRPSEY